MGKSKKRESKTHLNGQQNDRKPRQRGNSHSGVNKRLQSEVEHALLGALAGVLETIPSDSSGKKERYVDLTSNSKAILDHWRNISKKQKQDLLLVDLSVYGDPEDEALLREIVASFLLTMEHGASQREDEQTTPNAERDSNASYTLMHISEAQFNSKPCLKLIAELKSRLARAYTHDEIYRKIFLVLVYFSWRFRPNWWMGVLSSAVVLVLLYFRVEEAGRIRAIIRHLCDILFADDLPSTSNWKADSFITAVLLLTLASTTQWVIFVIFIALLPYVFHLFERIVRNMVDMRSLGNLRTIVSAGNKVLLVFFAWSHWSSLFLVCMLFFSELSLVLLQTVLGATGMGFYFAFSKIGALIPEYQRTWLHFTFLEGKRMYVSYGVLFLGFCWVLWATSDWSFPYGGLLRITVAGLVVVLFPMKWMVAILSLCASVILIPLNFIEYVVNALAAIAVRLGLVAGNANVFDPTESAPQVGESSAFIAQVNRRQEELRREAAEETS